MVAIMRTLILFTLVAISFQSSAEWIECTPQYEEDPASGIFKPFDKGSFYFEIESAEATLQSDSDGNLSSLSLISEATVSTYNAPRQTCALERSVSRTEQGTLESFFIAFGSCHYTKPGQDKMTAAVSTSIFYDFKSGRGLYQETYYEGGTTAIQPYFRFTDCRIDRD